MSEDETVVLVFSSVVGLFCWVWWYGSSLTARSSLVAGRSSVRGVLLVMPLLSALILLIILKLWSASDVRDDGRYLTMYFLLGAGWSGVASFIPAWLGISFRQDVLTRANHAASWVTTGWILAVTLSFAGANIGDGPGWWVVVFSAMLSTGMLTLVYFLWEKLVATNDAVTIDRDLATGLRMLGLFVGCGAVFGISAAGDWQSADATVRDFFLRAWPAVLIFLVAWILHALLRPSPEAPRPSVLTAGIIPMILLLAMGLGWWAFVGSHLIGDAA